MDAVELKYWITLQCVDGIGPATYQRLLERFNNDPENILLAAAEDEILAIPRINKRVAKGIISARKRIEGGDNCSEAARLLEGLNRSNVKIITSTDPSYPKRLNNILKAPPALIYVLGEHKITQERAVAIVGSTTPSAKGYKIAGECAGRLARGGCTIVSGYAKGIDTAAHLGALEAGGATILAIPTGINNFSVRPPYSPKAIRERAVVISESSPAQKWTTGTAMSRNRLIVALSDALIIVETRANGGGGMSTFYTAKRLGVRTFAIKYRHPPSSALGNSMVIEQGAIPISSLADIERLIM